MNKCYSSKKRLLSVLLCVVVLTTVVLVPINVSAQEVDNSQTSDYYPWKDSEYPKIVRDGVIYTLADDQLIITNCNRADLPENLVIPSEIDGYLVTYIWSFAFAQAQKLISVTIPNTIYDIEECAFQNCKNLKSVTFESGSTLKHVMEWGFAGCSSLESITLPASLKSIGDMMFENCTSLKSVTIENNSSLVYIGSYSFGNCENLEYFDVPASVEMISEEAFKNCYSLSRVDLHEGLIEIWGYAFFNCFSLAEIFIPDSVEEIGACALGCFEYEGDIYSNPEFVVVGSPDSLADEYAEAYMVTWEYGLSAPKLSSISNTTDGVKLTFEKLSGVSGQYRIYRKTADTTWTSLANITSNTYTDKTAESGVYYTYTVKFIGYDGTESRYDKNGLSITRLVTPKVTNITNTNDGVKLTISEVKGAAYYRVYYKTSDGWKGIDNTDTTTFVHESAKSGESYTYTVKAFDKYDLSSSFDSKGFTNQYIATPEITAVSSTKDGVKISWNKVTGAVNYRVYIKTSTGWKGLGNTTSTTFTDTSATSRGRYTYTVRCMAQDGKTTVSGYDKEGKSCTVFSRAPEKEMIDSINKIQRPDRAEKSPSALKPQPIKKLSVKLDLKLLVANIKLQLQNVPKK